MKSVVDAFLMSEPPVGRCVREPQPDPDPLPTVEPKPEVSVTRIMSGDNWQVLALTQPYQQALCGQLWFENEICIMFADTNVGKSLLAVQIADMISRGRQDDPSDCPLPELLPQTRAQPVVYADFELSIAQFARRYSFAPEGEEEFLTSRTYHKFDSHFYRVELSFEASDCDMDEFSSGRFPDMIIADLERRVVETDAKVLIIDNITFMASGTETAADAMPLMKKLTTLKKKHGLSILLLAHTPKRNRTNPLTRNDLQGSKMLINFADSAFAIGESRQGPNLRYIKQIKQRNCELIYGEDNVIECWIDRLEPTFIGFASAGTNPEYMHLEVPSEKKGKNRGAQRAADDERAQKARALKAEGKTVREIAAELAVSEATVYRMLSASGQR